LAVNSDGADIAANIARDRVEATRVILYFGDTELPSCTGTTISLKLGLLPHPHRSWHAVKPSETYSYRVDAPKQTTPIDDGTRQPRRPVTVCFIRYLDF